MVSTPGPSRGGRRITKGTKVREHERGGHQRGGDLQLVDGGDRGGIEVVSTPRPSKAEDESRRARKYERGGYQRGGDLRLVDGGDRGGIEVVSTPRPSKAEDGSRRARKYESTKGEGISAVETCGWLMGGSGGGAGPAAGSEQTRRACWEQRNPRSVWTGSRRNQLSKLMLGSNTILNAGLTTCLRRMQQVGASFDRRCHGATRVTELDRIGDSQLGGGTVSPKLVRKITRILMPLPTGICGDSGQLANAWERARGVYFR